jgi:hypothetical protein
MFKRVSHDIYYAKELIKSGNEKAFIQWMNSNNVEALERLNKALADNNKVNLLDYLISHGAIQAFNNCLTLGVQDIPGTQHNIKCTALFRMGQAILGMGSYEESVKGKEIVAKHISDAKMLIQHGSNVNFISPSPAHTLKKLPSEKANGQESLGKTVLMFYTLAGCIEMVQYILEHGGKETINTRSFELCGLGAYCAQETENTFASTLEQTNEGFRFDSALSIAFASNKTNDGRVLQLLLDNGADLSLFYDNEFYRPVLFSAVGNIDSEIGRVREECRKKVEIIVAEIKKQNLHIGECKETYKIFSQMLSEDGYRYESSCTMCTIL